VQGDRAAARRRDLLIALVLTLVAALTRLPRLGVPGEEFFDEVYHAKTAQQYIEGVVPLEWVHPPMAKILIGVGVRLFGYEPWAWRLLPALAGIAVAPVFFLLARQFLSQRAALLASVLLLADGVYLVQSRTAMTNIFAILFQLGSVLIGVRAAKEEPLPARSMIGLGAVLGLALATRWTSLWAWGFVGLVLLVVRRKRFFRWRELALAALAFVVLPVAIYVGSYYAIPDWSGHIHKAGLATLWHLQKDIWNYHAHLNATHPYFSNWQTWPWLYRPTWYYYKDIDGWVYGIFAVGNPAVWWLSVPISAWAFVTGLWKRNAALLFAGAGFFCMYLPWGISPRTLNYSHYLLEAIPYACLALGAALDFLWDGRLRAVARGYVVLVVALFLLFFPILTAVPIPTTWFQARFLGVGAWTWFVRWI
jgi:dolichyl-phosphate-mannose-protein mannosyltransferase